MEKIKIYFITVISLLISFWNKLSIPLVLLIICNIVDIITGLWKAFHIKEKITFKKIMWGTIKKISMYFLIITGFIIDTLINYTAINLGIHINLNGIIGSLIATWLVLDEILSILRNLIIIKVQMPNFLSTLVKKLKGKIEEKGDL